MYAGFWELFLETEIEKYNLIRMDITIIADTCPKLKEEIDPNGGKKLVKFIFSFDGILPSAVEIFYMRKILGRKECACQDHSESRKKKSI